MQEGRSVERALPDLLDASFAKEIGLLCIDTYESIFGIKRAGGLERSKCPKLNFAKADIGRM